MGKIFKSYYAVIFTSTQRDNLVGYNEMSQHMEYLTKTQPGFLGLESARNELGITVSYWESLNAIKNWKQDTEHLVAQKLGRTKWYQWYHLRICKVEREYEFNYELN